MSIRDNALNAKVDSEVIAVPEWDGKVEVRGMTSTERMETLRRFNDTNIHPDIVIACTFDVETGEHIFDPADRDTLANGPAGPVERIAMAAIRLSAIGEQDDIEQGLDADPLDDSSSN